MIGFFVTLTEETAEQDTPPLPLLKRFQLPRLASSSMWEVKDASDETQRFNGVTNAENVSWEVWFGGDM